ncbi:MAG TPA: hypothetical protein VGB13_04565 [Candidatus Krumholzibacteria bacterium]
MKLRDLPSELEPALTRLREKPESRRPCLVVEAHPKNSGLFIQYLGSAERPLVLEVCFNVRTREISGFAAAAKRFFGCEMRIAEDESFGVWDKECRSVVRGVEHGMHVLRHVLLLDWDRELFIDEIEDEPIDRVRRGIVLGGLG